VLVVSLVPVWVRWSTVRKGDRQAQLVNFAWIGAAGGALAVFAHVALAVVGSAALGAATSFELPVAVGLAAVGPATLGIASAADGSSATLVLGGLAAALVGLVIGVGRRQTTQRAEQALQVAMEHERAEVEHERAAVLAERNRLAREVHDVLAHTLGALSIQLEALDAQLDALPEVPRTLSEGVQRTKSLAADGLVEARRAVRALRDDAPPLVDQVVRLCELRGAQLVVLGGPSPA
jgi:signal transduction histidine kinase